MHRGAKQAEEGGREGGEEASPLASSASTRSSFFVFLPKKKEKKEFSSMGEERSARAAVEKGGMKGILDVCQPPLAGRVARGEGGGPP